MSLRVVLVLLAVVTGMLGLAPGVVSAASNSASSAAKPSHGLDPKIASGKASRDLAAARARWKAHGPASYDFEVTLLDCLCPQLDDDDRSARVVVRRGRPGRVPTALRKASSMPKLFAIVARAIRDRVASLSVTYDKRRGYVRHVAVDESLSRVDEQFGYDVAKFKARPAG